MKQQTLEQRLESYGVSVQRKCDPPSSLLFAASAVAGVGAILVPPPAEAAIVYSGMQEDKEVKIVGGGVQTQTVDLDGDGNVEFKFDLSFISASGSTDSFVQKLAVSAGGTAQVIKSNNNPARLEGNYTVSSLKVFEGVASDDLAASNTSVSGNFLNKQGFLGVKFEISNETHFGWIQYKANIDASIGTIIDWAYEDIPDKAIKTGEKSSFNWTLFIPAITAGN